MPDPVARVRLMEPHEVDSEVLAEWDAVQRVLVAWMNKGCAQVLKDGVVMDLATLDAVSVEGLGGCELLIFHAHVAQRYPWLLRRS